MKTIGLILFGSLLTITLQFINLPNLLINQAEASNNRPCVTEKSQYMDTFEELINKRYSEGYRVKAGGQHYNGAAEYYMAIMCKS